MVGLIYRCALWQHSQQTAPIRLPGKCTSDLAGWKHSHRWGTSKLVSVMRSTSRSTPDDRFSNPSN